LTSEEYLRMIQGGGGSQDIFSLAGRRPRPAEPEQKRMVYLPDGSHVKVGPEVTDEEALARAREKYPEIFATDEDSGPIDAFVSSLDRTVSGLIPGARAAVAVASGDEEAYDEAQARLVRASREAHAIAPDLLSVGDIGEAYDKDGLLSAIGTGFEFGAEQIGSSMGRVTPSLVTGAAGALLGSVLGPPGAALGGTAGFWAGRSLTTMLAFMSEELERDYAEGLVDTEDVSLGKVLTAAAGQTALDNLGFLILGPALRIGSKPAQGAARSAFARVADKISRSSPLNRFVGTLVEEEVAEIGQQALERWQAGLAVSPADEEAAAEYAEIALATLFPSIGFAGMGEVGHKIQQKRSLLSDAEVEQNYKDYIRVQEAVRKSEERLTAETVEAEAATRDMDSRQSKFWLGRMSEIAGGLREQYRRIIYNDEKVTKRDVVQIAEDRNILWDNDPAFMSFSKRLTGSLELDSMNDDQLLSMYKRISAMPRQESASRLAYASPEEAVDLGAKLNKRKSKSVTTAGVRSALGLNDASLDDTTTDAIADGYIEKMVEMGLVKAETTSSGDVKYSLSGSSLPKGINESLYKKIIQDAIDSKDGAFPSLKEMGKKYGIHSLRAYDRLRTAAITRRDIEVRQGKEYVSPDRGDAGSYQLIVNGTLDPTRYSSKKEAEEARSSIYSSGLDAEQEGVSDARAMGNAFRSTNPMGVVEIIENPSRPIPEVVEGYRYSVTHKPGGRGGTAWVVRKAPVEGQAKGDFVKSFSSKKKAEEYVGRANGNTRVFDVVVDGVRIKRLSSRSEANKFKRDKEASVYKSNYDAVVKSLGEATSEPSRFPWRSDSIYGSQTIDRMAREKALKASKAYAKSMKVQSVGVDAGLLAPRKEVGWSLSESRTEEEGASGREKSSRMREVDFFDYTDDLAALDVMLQSGQITQSRYDKAKEILARKAEKRAIGSRDLIIHDRTGRESVKGRLGRRARPDDFEARALEAVPEPTLEDVSTPVRKPLPPPPNDQSNLVKAVTTKLRSVLKQVGLEDVRINLVEALQDETGALATFNDATQTIELAYTVGLQEISSEETLVNILLPFVRHETIHAFRKLGVIKPQEWKSLRKFALKRKISSARLKEMNDALIADGKKPLAEGSTYLDFAQSSYSEMGNRSAEISKLENALSEGAMTEEEFRAEMDREGSLKWIEDDYFEEAIAQLYQDVFTGEVKLAGQPKGLILRAANFLKSVFRALTGQGYKSADEIFHSLYGDQMATRIENGRSLDPWWARRSGEASEIRSKTLALRGELEKVTDKRRKQLLAMGKPEAEVDAILQRESGVMPTSTGVEAGLDAAGRERKARAAREAAGLPEDPERSRASMVGEGARGGVDPEDLIRVRLRELRNNGETAFDGKTFRMFGKNEVEVYTGAADPQIMSATDARSMIRKLSGMVDDDRIVTAPTNTIDAAIKRGSFDRRPNGEIRLAGGAAPTIEEINRQQESATENIRGREAQRAKLEELPDDAGVDDVRSLVGIDSRETTKREAIRNFDELIADSKQYFDDLELLKEWRDDAWEERSPREAAGLPEDPTRSRASMVGGQLISEGDAHAAAQTQRGVPEAVMDEITAGANRAGFPAVLGDLLEHVGDISNRAQQHKGIAIINVREKVNKVLRFGSERRMSLEDDIEDSRRFNAEFDLLPILEPELKRLDDAGSEVRKRAGFETRSDLWNAFRKKHPNLKDLISKEVERQRRSEISALSRYVDAHETHNVALTEMGKLGKDMAIHLGKGEYDALMQKARVLDGLVSEYERLESEGRRGEAEALRLRPAPISPREAAGLPRDPTRSRASTIGGTRELRESTSVVDSADRGLIRDQPFGDEVLDDSFTPISPGAVPEDGYASGALSVGDSSWFGINYDGVGQYSESGMPVVVLSGHHEDARLAPDGTELGERGFGAVHLDRHNEDIQNLTSSYKNWRELLVGFGREMRDFKNKERIGEIVSYPEQGAVSFIWSSPEFKKPVLVRTMNIPKEGLGDVAYVVSAYPVDTFANPVGGRRNITGHLHGKDASIESIKTFLKPELSPKLRDSERRRYATNSYEGRSPEQVRALESVGLPQSGSHGLRTIWDSFSASLASPTKDWSDILIASMLDRFKRIERYGKLARAKAEELGYEGMHDLFDVSAHAMALMSDKAAGYLATSLRDGVMTYKHGVPMIEGLKLVNSAPRREFDPVTGRTVEREMVTVEGMYEEGSEGGLFPILEALSAKRLIPELFLYMRALRGARLNHEGRSVPFDKDVIAEGMEAAKNNPEIVVAAQNIQNWNDGIIQLQIDAGIISEEMGDVYRRYSDYIPFYVELEGVRNETIEGILSRELGRPDAEMFMSAGIANQRQHMKYSGLGKDQAILDPIESIVRNARAAITGSLRNIASQRAIRDALMIDQATEISSGELGRLGINEKQSTVTIRVAGENKHYLLKDPIFHEAIVGGFQGHNPYFEFLGIPARLLRSLVTRSPDYLIANMLRDSLHVYILNGGEAEPIIDAAKTMASNVSKMTRGEANETYTHLQRMGAISGVEHAELTPERLTRRFAMDIGKGAGVGNILRKFWDATGELSSRSESATRENVYESAYIHALNKYREAGFDRLDDNGINIAERKAMGEAAYQAVEVLNFSRHGSNPYMQLITATVPFLNSRLQGLATAARSMRGDSITGRLNPQDVKTSMLLRATTVSSVSAMYAAMAILDTDREKLPDHVKDDYWLLPIPGMDYWFGVPIPFEAGVMYKLVPEAITNFIIGEMTDGRYGGTRADVGKSLWHGITSTLSFNPTPQAIRPVWEWFANKNMFTGNPIVPQWQENMPGAEQYSDNTTAQARLLGSATGLSPRKIDNTLRTIFGGVGIYTLQALDNGLRWMIPGMPTRPGARATDLPIVRRFVRDQYGGGLKTDFYEMRNAIDGMMLAIKQVQGTEPERAVEMISDNADLLSVRGAVNAIERNLSKIRNARSKDFRTNRLTKEREFMYDEMESRALSMVPELKRMIAGR